jgi:hypothetical protein
MKKLVEKFKGICDKIARHKFYRLISRGLRNIPKLEVINEVS